MIQLIELWETYLMRLDADEEDEHSFNRSPPGPVGQQQTADEDAPAPPASQDRNSTETEPRLSAEASPEQDE